MSEQALLPCPFCGGENINVEDNSGKGMGVFLVSCDDCDFHIGGYVDRDSAIKKWNTRHTLSSKDLPEGLEEAAEYFRQRLRSLSYMTAYEFEKIVDAAKLSSELKRENGELEKRCNDREKMWHGAEREIESERNKNEQLLSIIKQLSEASSNYMREMSFPGYPNSNDVTKKLSGKLLDALSLAQPYIQEKG